MIVSFLMLQMSGTDSGGGGGGVEVVERVVLSGSGWRVIGGGWDGVNKFYF